MPHLIKVCYCEDFPCCGHAEIAEEPQWCDMCGLNHSGDCPDDSYYPPGEYDDEEDDDGD